MNAIRATILLILLGFHGASTAAEELSYLVSYRGLFSAGAWWDIAHASYLEGRADRLEPGAISELHVSSERLPTIDSLYPIRYLSRSLSTAGQGASIAFERFRRGSKTRHDTFVVDSDAGGLRRYRLSGSGPGGMPGWRLGEDRLQPHGEPLDLPGGVVVRDQLALVRAVRRLDWSVAEHRLLATDGKRMLDYVATLEKREVLPWQGAMRDCWKIRVAGFRSGGEDAGEPHHRPIHLWLTADDERMPIKVENRHAIGRFRLALLPPGAAGARIAPSVVDQLEVADVGDRYRRLGGDAIFQ